MTSLGLLGRDISHSLSPQVYSELLRRKIDYSLFDIKNETEIPSLEHFFNKVEGLSITSPYKRFYLGKIHLDPSISNLKAINCIRKSNFGFEATNTDYFAILEILPSLMVSNDTKIVILGDGVMAEVAISAINKLGYKYEQFSRRLTQDFLKVDFSKEFQKNLFINTCSREYVFKNSISHEAIFWDLNYKFKPHEDYPRKFVSLYLDGYTLLKKQAEYALKYFGIN